jgi:DNA polymerase-3 subunit delta'
MHHAWILAGKRGLGKSAFALAAARALVAEPGAPQPEGEHPDILLLTHPPKDDKEAGKRAEGKPYEVKRNIPIDSIRSMQQRLTTRPTLGSRRVVIVDPADDLEKSASNALLKSLEEPPVGTFFLLVVHRPARLLATIRSRCRTLRFPPLSDADIDALVQREAPDTDAATRVAVVAAAGGSPGVVREFLGSDLAPLDLIMRQAIREGDPYLQLRGKLVDAIGARPDRDRLQAALHLAMTIVAGEAEVAEQARYPALAQTHARLVALAAQAPTHNYDPGLLAMEIGTLLAGAARASDRAHA